MTTAPDPFPSGVDPAHILAVCSVAAPGHERDTAILVGGRHAACVFLPERRAARAAQAALSRVGYHADRPATGNSRDRDVIIGGWSPGGLDARLIAMRAVLEQLAADPGSTAATVLGPLGDLPEDRLPGADGQQQLIARAAGQLRQWIFRGSGIQVPHDPRFRPADTGCALRAAAAWQAEDAIDDVAARQVRVARHALALYPALRQQLGHEGGRDAAIRQARITFHLCGTPIARDTSPLLASTTPAPGTPAAAPDTAPAAEASTRPGPGPRTAREFPAFGAIARPPPTGPARLSGRNFPSGRSGPHP